MSHKPAQPATYKVDALLDPNRAANSADTSFLYPLIRINAAGIADPSFGVIEQGAIVLQELETGYKVVAIGTKDQIDQIDLPDSIMELTLHNRLLMPALVNAHTHLDLTHIGPIAHDPSDGFVKWIDHIRSNRRAEDDEISAAVVLGIQASLSGGTIAVGDIAGAPGGRLTDAPALKLARSPMFGVSFLEFFGIGKTAPGAIKKVEHYLCEHFPGSAAAIAGTGVEIGLQPHAPNTVDLGVYRWVTAAAKARGIPLSTHLAETPEEREFIGEGTGPQRELLDRLGVWDDAILDHIAKDKHPVEHLAEVLGESPYLVAHVNDAIDHAIETLAATNTSVAYCPRASTYFGAERHFGPHRYRDMLGAGVNVCLGTDSIVNLDTPDRISVLDEMRHLARRDGTDAMTLLQMGTTNGAVALGLEEQGFTLRPDDQPLGLIAVPIEPRSADSWQGAMASNEPPEWVFLQAKEQKEAHV